MTGHWKTVLYSPQKKLIVYIFDENVKHISTLPSLRLGNGTVSFLLYPSKIYGSNIPQKAKMAWSFKKGKMLKIIKCFKNTIGNKMGCQLSNSSKLDYGIIAYSSARDSRIKILDNIHNSDLRICSDCV